MPTRANPDKGMMAPPLIEIDPLTGREVGAVEEDPGCVRVILAPVFLLALPALTVWLYPLVAVPTAAVALFASEIASVRLAGMPVEARATIVGGIALVLFYLLMRLDQRLGEWRAYRWPRHAVRLLVIGVVFNLLARVQIGLPDDPAPTQAVQDTLTNGSLLTATIAGVAVAQITLFFGSWLRPDWRQFLRMVRLRSKSLSE